MLSMYLGSVVVFMLIIFASATICEDNARKNGWLDEPHKGKHSKTFAILFTLSAVPIFRVLFTGFIFVMAIYPKEKVIAWIEEHKNLNS